MKVCFIGTGSIGSRHITNLSTLCEQRNIPLEIHAYRATQHPLQGTCNDLIDRQFSSWNDADDQYDAIFICNPSNIHYQSLAETAQLSRCFFVEKPLFASLHQSLSALALPLESVYYVACPLRHTKIYQAAREIITDSRIYSARAICSSYLPDWRPQIDYRKNYSAIKAQGGGVRLDLIHEWDYLVGLFHFPEEVKAFYGTYSDLEIDSEDLAVYIAKYPDFLTELHLDYFGRSPQRYLELFCRDEVWKLDFLNAIISKQGSVYRQYREHSNDKYLAELSYFLDLYQGLTENINSPEHALRVMKIAHMR